MGAKNRNKKRTIKPDQKCSPNAEDSVALQSGDINDMSFCFTEDCKQSSKDLPFASISNKQFKCLGLVPDKKPAKTIVTIPLRFPSKLMPTFRKIFNFGKHQPDNKEKPDCGSALSSIDSNFITLISFKNYTQRDQQIRACSQQLPTLQVTRVPVAAAHNKPDTGMGLYLSETSLKPDTIVQQQQHQQHQQFWSSPPAATDGSKVTKKRSFFNEIWKKRQQQPVLAITNGEPNPRPCVVAPASESVPSTQAAVLVAASPTSADLESTFSNVCIACNKQAFIAERIQIGADVFHSACFKCSQCAKCLYRGKWNKNQDQYICDNCNKKTTWSFVRKS